MSQYSFPNQFRLKHRKSINNLFETGRSFNSYPVKMLFLDEKHDDGSSIKFGFSVPKKNFKRAVQRNLLKRRMKEALRINRSLFPPSEKSFSVFFIFTSKEAEAYQVIEGAIISCLVQLKNYSK